MNRSHLLPACKLFLLPLFALVGVTSLSQGGPIVTPDSILVPPASTLPAVHGTLVAPGGFVDDQYGGLGLAFVHSAITEINGVKVWTPTGDSSTINGSSLYYGANATIVGGFVVPGDPDTPRSVGSVKIELIGVPVGEALVGGYDRFFKLKVLTGNNNENLLGPNGGILALLEGDNLAAFAVTYPYLKDPDHPTAPWGIASVEVGEVAPVSETPEPGTLLLAGMGLAGFLGYRWRRQRPQVRGR
jgi:PEP-CTERM motif